MKDYRDYWKEVKEERIGILHWMSYVMQESFMEVIWVGGLHVKF